MEASTNLGRVSLVPRGEYDPAAQYERLDVVGYGGSGYLVLRPVQGVVPSNGADYMLISEKGGKGDKGDLGDAAGFGTVSAAVDDTVGTPSVEVSASGPNTAKEFAFSFHGLKGEQGVQGDKGDPGSNIASIERTAGTGAPGTRDTYTITLTDGTTSTFQVYNGADGVGAGDMTAAVYDPQGRAQDIFQYVDDHTPKDAVTVPGGGAIEMGDALGEGPYTFEYEEDGEGGAVSAEEVSYDASASGLEAVTVQAALDALNAVKADVGRVSNSNLLDNWYLADPINQRNKTKYTELVYTIDRWALAQGELMLQEGHTLLQKHTILYQRLDTPAKYVGKQMSASVLLSDNTLISVSGVMSDTSHVESAINGTTLFMGAVIGFGLTFPVVCIRTDPQNPVMPQAIKLELGPIQTLAHKEGDTWVLNDPPPDPALELAKCQRYQLVFDKGVVGWFQCLYTGTGVSLIQTPVTMRVNPAITLNGKLLLQRRRSEAYLNVSASNIGSINYNSSAVSVDLVNLEGDTVGEIYNMRLATGSKLILDANL